MGKGSKIFYWAGAGAAFLSILLIALAVIVPRVIDSAWLKETIQTEIAKQVNGTIDFQKAEISILPNLSVALQQVSLNIPGTIQVSLDTIKVNPKFLPLLVGNIELDTIVIVKPDFSLLLPKRSATKQQEEKPFSLAAILEIASSKLAPVVRAIPGLDVNVDQGVLRLFSGDQQVFLFENITAEFDVRSKSLKTSISSSSNLWKSMELQANITPGSKGGKGKITFENFNGQVLTDYFLAERFSPLAGSLSSLQASFTIDPEAGLQAALQSSGLTFTALNKNEKITAIIENLEGSIQYTDQISSITVQDITLSNPQIKLSGSFILDNTVPHASLDIKAQNADITSLQEVLPVFISTLFGDLPVAQEIFNITKAGTVTRASFHVAGKSLADLGEFESMLIQGHAEDAEISLSDLSLNLEGVTGDVIISDGLFEGKNLQAKLGNSTGTGGTLKLGLVKKEITPFHLDLDLNADLSEVPPLLKQLLPDKNFHEYLALFENYAGTSRGRLTLGESLEFIKVRVEVDTINAQANFKPIPYPVTIDDGRFLYDGVKTQSYDLQGKIGKSTYSNYSSSINFKGEPRIEVQSGTFHVVLDEIFPLLTSHKKLAQELKNIKSITGLAEVTVKNIQGPLLKPANLEYEVQGSLENVTLTSAKLPGPLNIKNGQIKIQPDKITFIDLQADLLDSSLTYSGILQDYINGKTNAEVIVTNAEIDEQVSTWFAEQIKAPKEYKFKTPFLISRADAKWTRNELLDLQGDFSIKNGPIFSIDIMTNQDELLLRNLLIKNGNDRATLKLNQEKRKISAAFQGSLSKKTIDEILSYKEADHKAWIKGDISVLINMDSYSQSTATGKLDGGDFMVPWKPGKYLTLESFSIAAADKTLTINSAEAVFANRNFALSGTASLTQDYLSMDLDINTDNVDLDKIFEALQVEENEKEEEEEEEEEGKAQKTWDFGLHSNIKFNADSLLYNGDTWKPFEVLITNQNSFLSIEVLKAELCSLSTPGKISFHEGKISLDFQMEMSGQELQDVLICLEGGKQQMTGTLDLKANISGQGTKESLVNSLQGSLHFSAKEGFIYQDARPAKLLSFLNVTNMFQGKIPDLRTTGFNYDYLIVKGDMKNGILEISPAKLDAPILEIVSHGTIDIPRKRVNLQVLVAPLQTLNKIQKMVPIISKLIPSSLVAMPVEIIGDFSDIKVRALSMSAISRMAFGIMIDALSTPVRVLEDTSVEVK